MTKDEGIWPVGIFLFIYYNDSCFCLFLHLSGVGVVAWMFSFVFIKEKGAGPRLFCLLKLVARYRRQARTHHLQTCTARTRALRDRTYSESGTQCGYGIIRSTRITDKYENIRRDEGKQRRRKKKNKENTRGEKK